MVTAARMSSMRAVMLGVIDPRPHVEYHGVPMRSRLEADFAAHLDKLGAAWSYEPRIFGAQGRGYLPDFQIVRPGRPCFVEVKPLLVMVARAQRRMEVIWTEHPDAVLLVVCAQGSTFSAATRTEPWQSWSELWVHQ